MHNFQTGFRRVAELRRQLRECLSMVLDQGWFYKSAEDLPVRCEDLQPILASLAEDWYLIPDIKRLKDTIHQLENLITDIKRFLLPVLKDRLGISNFSHPRPDKKSDQYIQHSLIAYALPINLQRIEALLGEITTELSVAALPASLPPLVNQVL